MVTPLLDLSQTPTPQLVENLDFQARFTQLWDEFVSRASEYSSLTAHDPAQLLAHAATLELIRASHHINETGVAAMLAFAQGSDLDALVAGRNLQRLLIDPGDLEAVPPRKPIYEDDDALRRRALLALESKSASGPRATYLAHALAADPKVRDAFAYSPTPGDARVVLLSHDDQGAASQTTIDAVFNRLNRDTVRPITDRLTVVSANIVEYTIRVHLTIRSGVEPQLIADQTKADLDAFSEDSRKIGNDVRRSKISAVCHAYRDHNGNTIVGTNIENVDIQEPLSDVVIDRDSAPYCASVTVTFEEATNV